MKHYREGSSAETSKNRFSAKFVSVWKIQSQSFTLLTGDCQIATQIRPLGVRASIGEVWHDLELCAVVGICFISGVEDSFLLNASLATSARNISFLYSFTEPYLC